MKETEPDHLMTSPKGQALLTVLLTVMASVAPFFGTLEFAIFAAIIAVIVILWLYGAEYGSCLKDRSKWRGIITPSASILLIGLMIMSTSWAASRTGEAPVQAALTPTDFAEEVGTVLNLPVKQTAETRVSTPSTVVLKYEPVRQTLPEVATQKSLPVQSVAEPSTQYEDVFEQAKKQLNRATAGNDEYYKCRTERSRASGSLARLRFAASQYQNAFYHGRNSKKMVADLALWKGKARDAFDKHETILPSFQIFELAMPKSKANNFLGIDNSGANAWAEMDAKSDALEVLSQQLDNNKPCEKLRDAAIRQCERSGACVASSEQKNESSKTVASGATLGKGRTEAEVDPAQEKSPPLSESSIQ